ncbi:uncharacterized protein [Antedon mediterranea]|uniref:uncharacterized protein isoform X2 n=1 Tax=Antedon mediterranea TaxID=105859 RepID=UPI003AF6D1C5
MGQNHTGLSEPSSDEEKRKTTKNKNGGKTSEKQKKKLSIKSMKRSMKRSKDQPESLQEATKPANTFENKCSEDRREESDVASSTSEQYLSSAKCRESESGVTSSPKDSSTTNKPDVKEKDLSSNDCQAKMESHVDTQMHTIDMNIGHLPIIRIDPTQKKQKKQAGEDITRALTDEVTNDSNVDTDMCETCGIKNGTMSCDVCEHSRCDSCDKKWHNNPKRRSHQRRSKKESLNKSIEIKDNSDTGETENETEVNGIKDNTDTLCETCGVKVGTMTCDVCGNSRCDSCDKKWHNNPKRRTHQRTETLNKSIEMKEHSDTGKAAKEPELNGTRKESLKENESLEKSLKSEEVQQRGQSVPLNSIEMRLEQKNLENIGRNYPELKNYANVPEVSHENGRDKSDVFQPNQMSTCYRSDNEELLGDNSQDELCVLCGVEKASIPCQQCGDARCVQCDAKWHRHKNRNKHIRNKTQVLQEIADGNPKKDTASTAEECEPGIKKNDERTNKTEYQENENDFDKPTEFDIFTEGLTTPEKALSLNDRQTKADSHIDTQKHTIDMNIGPLPIIRIDPTQKQKKQTAEGMTRQGLTDEVTNDSNVDTDILCETCGVKNGTISCDICENFRCDSCDKKWHNHSNRRTHQPRPRRETLNKTTIETEENSKREETAEELELNEMTEESIKENVANVGHFESFEKSLKSENKKVQQRGQSVPLSSNIEVNLEQKNLENIGRNYPEFENYATVSELSHENCRDKSNILQPNQISTSYTPDNEKLLGDNIQDEPCVLCGVEKAIIPCQQCGDARCVQCDAKWHRHKNRNKHIRNKTQVLKEIADGNSKKDTASAVECEPEIKQETTNETENQENDFDKTNKTEKALNDCQAMMESHVDTHMHTIDMNIGHLTNIRIDPTQKQAEEDMTRQALIDEVTSKEAKFDEDTICDTCGVKVGTMTCDECENSRCDSCDQKWHNHSKRRTHQRRHRKETLNKTTIGGMEENLDRGEPELKGMKKDSVKEAFVNFGNSENLEKSLKSKENKEIQQRVTLHNIEMSLNQMHSENIVIKSFKNDPIVCEDIADSRGNVDVKLDTTPRGYRSNSIEMQLDQMNSENVGGNPEFKNYQKGPELFPRNGGDTSDVLQPNQTSTGYRSDNEDIQDEPCVLCGIEKASIPCQQCGDARCVQCDAKWHRHKNRNKHIRNKAQVLQEVADGNPKKDTASTTECKPEIKKNDKETKGGTECKDNENDFDKPTKEPCVLCGVDDAIIHCDECGDARCIKCDTKWHRHKKRNSHKRNQPPSNIEGIIGYSSTITLPNIMPEKEFSDPGIGDEIEPCGICGKEDGAIICNECVYIFCKICDEKYHHHKDRKTHERRHKESNQKISDRVENNLNQPETMPVGINEVSQKLKSDYEVVTEKINALELRLQHMDYKGDEERKDIEGEHKELLRKRQLLMVRIEAVDAIENTSHSSHAGSTSLNTWTTKSEVAKSDKPRVVSGRSSLRYVIDHDVETDGPVEYENANQQHDSSMQDDVMMQEARNQGFDSDDIRIAKEQCKQSGCNFVQWLKFNYKAFIAEVCKSVTNELHQLIPGVRIAEASVIRSLVKYPGDVNRAKATCVRKFEAQICEILQFEFRKDSHKLTMHEVSQYLYKCNGDVDKVMAMIKTDGYKLDIAERIWKYEDEIESVSVLLKKPEDFQQEERHKRLIMAEFDLTWDVASRLFDKIQAHRRNTKTDDSEFSRWVLNTLRYASKHRTNPTK